MVEIIGFWRRIDDEHPDTVAITAHLSFPDESFYYLCGDCDDHAILFARLAKDLLGLDVLLVECQVDGSPHASTAIRFTEPLDGDSILYEGQNYYCCEPSSNVAKVGDRCWENYVVTRVDKVK